MDIYALSSPYSRQEILLETVPVSPDNTDRARNNPADRSLVVKQNQDVSPYLRRRREDEVELSPSARDGREDQPPQEKGPEPFLNNIPRPRDRNWDHKLLSWFRTALTLQGNLPQNRGVHINIFV
jgi:hypothetical protein